ncbi:MAG: DUF1080 domain-containing protein [Planctomycetes bacterium]|nr:DUF1080 domain-containing protein [Planctomycetota bacterium]
MRRFFLVCASIGILAATAAAAERAQRGQEFLGRWDIRIFETGDDNPTFASSWWKVERGDDGLRGAMVWRWGSVTDVARAEIAGGEVRLTRREGNRDAVYRAKLVGGELLGFVDQGRGRVQYFVGRRAPEMAGVAGKWKLIMAGGTEWDAAYLILDEKDGKLTGRGIDPEGQNYPVVRAALDGAKLTVGVRAPDSGAVLRGEGQVRGDRMAVKVTLPEGDAIEFAGQRERAWGEPVVLFDGKSLAGWKARDAAKKFGWKVEDGAMVNSPPDVDIVSEKRFRDFRLHIEFNVDPGANSGVYLRGRYEMQILDDHGKGVESHGNGAVYSRIVPKKNASKPAGEWQAADVTLIGRWLTVVMNGETIIDNEYLDGITGGALDPWEGEPGPILLQGDHGRVRYRNITIAPAK